MDKYTEDDIVDALSLVQVPTEFRQNILETLKRLKSKEDKEPKVKKPKGEYLVVLKSPGEIPDNTVASVFLVPQETDPATLLDSVRAAAVDFNISRKKGKMPFVKFFDILFSLKPKFQKARQFKIITREPLAVIVLKPGEEENFITTKVADKEDFS